MQLYKSIHFIFYQLKNELTHKNSHPYTYKSSWLKTLWIILTFYIIMIINKIWFGEIFWLSDKRIYYWLYEFSYLNRDSQIIRIKRFSITIKKKRAKVDFNHVEEIYWNWTVFPAKDKTIMLSFLLKEVNKFKKTTNGNEKGLVCNQFPLQLNEL